MKRFVLFALCAGISSSRALYAQVAPNDHWRTIYTLHFNIDFPRELESLARRAGGEAERAYTRLSAELTPPRGPIDIVLSDNQDQSNGQASTFPTNRIIIWAHPPIDDASLRFGDDWMQQVVTHELTHIFHLDRSRGMWRLGQYIFGRHPALFPNARSPRWLMEGIAVEYESKLGSGGRLNGSELYATLDAVASGDRSLATPPRLSIAAPYYPGGNLAYFGGAWLVNEAARVGGDGSMKKFIERTAVYPIPYMWDWAAERAFGASFGTLASHAPTPAPADATPAVSPPYWDARAPRWLGDTIYYTATLPSETPALYAAHGPAIRRVARRNNSDAFGFAGTQPVYAQLDYIDPYRLTSSLYVHGARVNGAQRLESPDVRLNAAGGSIVAADPGNGASRVIILDSAGQHARWLSAADPDTQWSAPRWSRRGDRIAAIRWTRGGESAVVVLDTLGHVLTVYDAERAVVSHPSWDVNDRALYFTSDRTGHTAPYVVATTGADSGVVRQVAQSAFGLYDAEVSPDGKHLAAFRLSAEGTRLVVLALGDQTVRTLAVSGAPVFAPGRHDTAVTAQGAVHAYSPWSTLVPRYWVPTLGTSARNNTLPGFYTSSTDVVGRHAFAFNGAWDVKSGEFYGDADWTYRGLGLPVIDAAVSQGWSFTRLSDNAKTTFIDVTRRNTTMSLSFTLSRPRVRTDAFISLAPQVEIHDFRASPDSLKSLIVPPLPGQYTYPSVLLSAGWTDAARPTLALGPEDGVSVSASARERWRSDRPGTTMATSVIGVGAIYKSLPFAGYAHQVLALRGSFGWAQSAATSLFTAGGVSGTSLELVPGYVIGDAQRAFFVRGFPANIEAGTRAWAGTAEYRAPLPRIGRGVWPLPLFFQRTGIAVFGDAGSAWCPFTAVATTACPAGGTARNTLASIGAELLLDAAIEYDTPTRFRMGYAAPVAGREAVAASRGTLFFTLGLPF